MRWRPGAACPARAHWNLLLGFAVALATGVQMGSYLSRPREGHRQETAAPSPPPPRAYRPVVARITSEMDPAPRAAGRPVEGIAAAPDVAYPEAGVAAAVGDPPERAVPGVLRPRGPRQRVPASARLLARSLSGGRLVYYDLGDQATSESSVEGSWSPIPGCAGVVGVDYEQHSGGSGAVRGVGRSESAQEWEWTIVAPAHSCAEASRESLASRRATPSEAQLLAPHAEWIGTPLEVVRRNGTLWVAGSGGYGIFSVSAVRAERRHARRASGSERIRLIGLHHRAGADRALFVQLAGERLIRIFAMDEMMEGASVALTPGEREEQAADASPGDRSTRQIIQHPGAPDPPREPPLNEPAAMEIR